MLKKFYRIKEYEKASLKKTNLFSNKNYICV